jgi:CRP/FNR family transcriptional regulator
MAETVILNSCTVGENKFCCFDQLSADEMALITNNQVEVNYKKGENICKQGAFATHLMVLSEGLAKIYMEGHGESLILKILPAVNIIGLPFLFDGTNVFQYSAQAYIDSKVKLIEINTFKKLINTNAKFASSVISLLCENTIISYGRFFCLTRKQTYGRLADILLCLAQRIYKKDVFTLELNRKELAELSGMSLESTVRILTKFKNDGLIKIVGKEMQILDFKRLMSISKKG